MAKPSIAALLLAKSLRAPSSVCSNHIHLEDKLVLIAYDHYNILFPMKYFVTLKPLCHGKAVLGFKKLIHTRLLDFLNYFEGYQGSFFRDTGL